MASIDDSVPKPPPGRHLRARDAIVVVVAVVVLLVLFKGASIRESGEEMQPGFERDVVLAVGRPAGWVADRLPFDEVGDRITGWLSSDDDLGTAGGFDRPIRGGRAGTVAPVTPDSFDPGTVGENPARRRELKTLLVTGDSLAMPLDVEVARRLAPDGVKVLRDPHLGTGVSKSGFVDWGKLSTQQVRSDSPDAVVVFIGANEGFDMPGPNGRDVRCCGRDWAAVYATRVRRMMNTYRQAGAARVYWLTLPFPRDRDRQEVARAVNAAIEVAAQPYRAQVRVLDMVPVFTPGGRYRAAMTVDGRQQIVREPDGIHLNGTGAEVAADIVLDAVDRDYRH
ncbi:MAG TPA: GDSL-type esterase/lipase family protein [Thermoleophilaceae bacterium]